MKAENSRLAIVAVLMSLALSAAAAPLPADCDGTCASKGECLSCMSSCETYISANADLSAVLDSIITRSPVSFPALDPLTVKNFESCWCSACCAYGYAGDTSHPCIFPCPCTRDTSPTTTTTTPAGYDQPVIPLNTSVGEIEKLTNLNVCLLLNIIWMLLAAIAAFAIIIAGLTYLTADDPGKRNKAKSMIVYALTGLVIALIACPGVDLIIENTNIVPFKGSCKCYELMEFPPRPESNGTTEVPITKPTFAEPTERIRVTTTRSSTTTAAVPTSTTTTTTPKTPCDDFKEAGKLPTAFNWRNVNGKNFNTPVKKQECGDCWAHAACGATEGTYKVEKWNPSINPNIAEQYLVSTCFPTAGCGGLFFGDEPELFGFIQSQGVSEETCYPYKGGVDSQCSERCADYATRLWKISGYGHVANNADKIKEALLCNGPLYVGSMNWGHAFTLSGWDTTGWIIKNSWGTGWGNGGYGTLEYGSAYTDFTQNVYYVDGVKSP